MLINVFPQNIKGKRPTFEANVDVAGVVGEFDVAAVEPDVRFP